jgi:hypothetical protein
MMSLLSKIIYTYYFHYYQFPIHKNGVPGFDLYKSRYALTLDNLNPNAQALGFKYISC